MIYTIVDEVSFCVTFSFVVPIYYMDNCQNLYFMLKRFELLKLASDQMEKIQVKFNFGVFDFCSF